MKTQRSAKTKTLLAVSAVATALAVLAPVAAQADTPTPSLVDLNATLMAHSPHAGGVFSPSWIPDWRPSVGLSTLSSLDSSKITVRNTAVNKIGDPDTKDGDTWYVGSSKL